MKITPTTPAQAMSEVQHICSAPAQMTVEHRVASIAMFMACLDADPEQMRQAARTLALHASEDLIAALRAADSQIADLILQSGAYVRIH